jgi:hypothetical protein
MVSLANGRHFSKNLPTKGVVSKRLKTFWNSTCKLTKWMLGLETRYFFSKALAIPTNYFVSRSCLSALKTLDEITSIASLFNDVWMMSILT